MANPMGGTVIQQPIGTALTVTQRRSTMANDHAHTPECTLCSVPEAERERVALERLCESIARNGWAGTGIFDPDGILTPYNYTIGFRPNVELLIVGLPWDTAHSILTDAVEKPVERSGVFHDVIRDFPVIARFVTPDDAVIRPSLARLWRAGTGQSPEFDLLQLLWPDQLGVYPTHPDYSSVPQPVLADR